MRRRRLRWDTADRSIPVRGKRGWIDHIVQRVGVPQTLEELCTHMRSSYQDYEDYVYNQLKFDDEDETAGELGFYTSAGNSTRIPKMFIPDTWKLDPSAVNVSAGVKSFIERVVSCADDRLFSKAELNHIPWVIDLCERRSNGRQIWVD